MRPTRLTLGIAAVVVTLMGSTTAAIRRAADEPIKQPVISFEQTPNAITVRIHNPNKHWGMRNQHVRIALYQHQSHPFNWYGPDDDTSVEGFPELGRIRCCLITELRPGGDYAFRLLPSKRFRVNTVTIDVVGPPGWVQM